MFRRRGCLLGCGGWLLLCVLASVLVWFVVLPRVSDALENGLSEGISTAIADQIQTKYSPAELRQGAEVEFSFQTINNEMRSSNEDGNVDSVVITSSGDQLVIRADINSQTFEFGFVPSVTAEGRLSLEPVDDGGWWQSQIMNVLGGGFEKSINGWLDKNDLRLTDISLEGDSLILGVTGE